MYFNRKKKLHFSLVELKSTKNVISVLKHLHATIQHYLDFFAGAMCYTSFRRANTYMQYTNAVKKMISNHINTTFVVQPTINYIFPNDTTGKICVFLLHLGYCTCSRGPISLESQRRQTAFVMIISDISLQMLQQNSPTML